MVAGFPWLEEDLGEYRFHGGSRLLREEGHSDLGSHLTLKMSCFILACSEYPLEALGRSS